VGGAFVSDKHANFILNDGTATSKDVYLLTQMIKDRVLNEFGVNLETEIEFVGEF
jgi:UDP-N-acetylmuramate dehydrogenase